MSRRVVVVGAGITGLTISYRLLRRSEPLDVVVLEAGDGAGGVIRSVRVGDLELEAGPDSFLVRKPWALELCRGLGLAGDLIEQGATAAQILTPSGLVAVPAGRLGIARSAGELWAWPGMSAVDRLRAIAEPIVRRRREDGDESVGSLARRRLGRGATEAIIAPLLGGLYAGDIDRLSVLATYPELARWEREDGNLRRGVRRATSAPPGRDEPRTPFATVRGGLRRIVEELASRIGVERLRTGLTVRGIGRDGDGFSVSTDAGREAADVVVLTTPAPVAAELLSDLAPVASTRLGEIRAASTAVASFVYPAGTAEALPASSGFVVQRRVGLPITAATALSRKWPKPDFGSRAVVRAFVGGVGLEADVERDDEEILDRAGAALGRVYDLPAPEHAALVRWPGAMPQYDVGHLERIAAIAAALPPGIHVAGSAFGGVGIPDRVREGTELAERIAAGGYPGDP